MFRIKICGLTSADDAAMTAACGADAVGLNFYPKSPRFISPERAKEVVAPLPETVVKVGLFVNAPADEVRAVFGRLSLDLVQLHGDEPPEHLADLAPLPILRAFRIGAGGLTPICTYLERCHRLGCLPQGVLLDAGVPGQYGGTGQTADWTAASQYPCEPWHPPLVLAGGLTAANVAEAVAAVRPAAVDTASGVESSPGSKSLERVREFVAAAKRALER